MEWTEWSLFAIAIGVLLFSMHICVHPVKREDYF